MDSAVVQFLTLVIAVIGAVLGLLNTWRSFNNDRVRLVVADSIAFGRDGHMAVLVEVRNLSSFNLTISRFGFYRHGTNNHLQVPAPLLTTGGQLPKRLEPRTSLTLLVPLATLEPNGLQAIRVAYVGTACGVVKTSRGAGIRQLQQIAAT